MWHPEQRPIRLAWDTNALPFSQAEKTLIRDALQTYNQLPNAQLHFQDYGETCTYSPSSLLEGQICIAKFDEDVARGWAQVSTAETCRVRWCTIMFTDEVFNQPVEFQWKLALHEFAHCLGAAHKSYSLDWMAPTILTANQGQQHIGMTRDIQNYLSWRYPFGSNYHIGGGMGANSIDILVRSNKAHLSDVVPWYGAGYNNILSTFVDNGEVSDDGDFGNETTLAYLHGDFRGDGPPLDVAAGMCTGCDPSDNAGDVVNWWVMRGGDTYATKFASSSSWLSDFGDGEDYDQYRVGDVDGNGCDDLILIRNQSSREPYSDYGRYCDGTGGSSPSNNCRVRLYVARARNASNYNPPCDRFDTSSRWIVHEMEVSDRSAASAWPWVVGDFYTVGDSQGCADIAYAEPSQSDPRQYNWHVLRSFDNNYDGYCDYFVDSLTWTNWGDSGMVQYFAADVGTQGSTGDDLLRVYFPLTSSSAQWGVAYSNGSNAFTGHSYPYSVAFNASSAYWIPKAFGVVDLNGGGLDLVMLLGGAFGGSAATWAVAGLKATGSTWSLGSSVSVALPGQTGDWSHPTDRDVDSYLDNGGDDAKDSWWYSDCDLWYE